jgi:Predicted transcriptional regulators
MPKQKPTRRKPGGLHTQRHWTELDLPHPARLPPAWCETLSGLAGLAGWHCPNDIVGASQDAERNGVVERRFYSMSPPRAEYVLTEKGRDLGPIVGAMRNWGRKYSS